MYKLEKDKIINSVWTFNSVVFLKKSEAGDERGKKVDHIDGIEYYLS